MAKETNRIDIYQAVTDDILAMLEAGTKPWVKPWSGGPTIPLRHTDHVHDRFDVMVDYTRCTELDDAADAILTASDGDYGRAGLAGELYCRDPDTPRCTLDEDGASA